MSNWWIGLIFFLLIAKNVNAVNPDVSQLSAQTYITPITNAQKADLELLISKAGYGSKKAAMGFSVGYEYMNTGYFAYGIEKNYDLNLDVLNGHINSARKYSLPMLVHANAHKWTLVPHLELDRETHMWDQNGKTFLDYPGYSSKTRAEQAGSWLWSLNEYNTKYFSLREKNFRQLARALANFNKENPDLFAGMSLDSETAMMIVLEYMSSNSYSSFDYNPGTIRQWREYVAGINYPNGLYATGGRLNGKGLNLTLAQINSRWGTNYHNGYGDVVAPRVNEAKIVESKKTVFEPESGYSQAMWDDWKIFKETLVHNFIARTVQWAIEEGVPAEKVFSHQAAEVHNQTQQMFWGNNTVFTGNIPGSGNGTDMYNEGVIDEPTIKAMSESNRLWGIMEWNPGPRVNTINALNMVWNYGIKSLNPNYLVTNDGDIYGLNIGAEKDVTGKVILDQIGTFVREKNGNNKQIVGSIDGWNGNVIEGWLCDLAEPNRPLSFAIRNPATVVVASGVANVSRSKVVADICGSSQSYHGFSILIENENVRSQIKNAFFVTVDNSFTGSAKTFEYKAMKEGDFNADGKIDLLDFGVWKVEYLAGRKTLIDFGVWKKAYLTN